MACRLVFPTVRLLTPVVVPLMQTLLYAALSSLEVGVDVLAGNSVVLGVDVGNVVLEDRLNTGSGLVCIFQRVVNPSLVADEELAASATVASSSARTSRFSEFGVDAPGIGSAVSSSIALGASASAVPPGNWVGGLNTTLCTTALLSLRVVSNPLDAPGTDVGVVGRASCPCFANAVAETRAAAFCVSDQAQSCDCTCALRPACSCFLWTSCSR